MLRVRLLNMFVLFALSINTICSPLLAMEEEQEQTRHSIRPLKSVVYESVIKGGIGVCLVYMGIGSSTTDDSLERHMRDCCKTASSVYGIRLIASAINNVGSCLYENCRHYITEYKINRIRNELNKIKIFEKNKKILGDKRRDINTKINALTKSDFKEELAYCKNYVKCGADIFQQLFVATQTFNTIHQWYNNEREIDIFFLNLMNTENDFLKPKISLLGTASSLLTLGWSIHSLHKQWIGEKFACDAPLKSFLRAVAGLTTSSLLRSKLKQDFQDLTHIATASLIKAKHVHTMAAISSEHEYHYLTYASLIILTHFYSQLQSGNGLVHFYEGCKRIYAERNYWFGLVDDLAKDSPTQEETTKFEQQSNQTNLEREIPDEETAVKEALDQLRVLEIESMITKRSEEDSNETMLKAPKKKTRGTPNKHLFPSKKKASTPINLIEIETEEDRQRKENLANIEEMRRGNSVPSHKLYSEFTRAAKFVNDGQFKADGNSFSIKWKRGTRERTVNFEWSHNQGNEKASVFKGKKLEKALDALEQIYLDGWQKRKILNHLNGRFLYNVPY